MSLSSSENFTIPIIYVLVFDFQSLMYYNNLSFINREAIQNLLIKNENLKTQNYKKIIFYIVKII